VAFRRGRSNHVLSADLRRELQPGEDEVGWLAKSGRLPLALLGDPEATARTYPVIDDVRYAVPGDRARVRPDGSLEIYGRDWSTINTGGEKVFAEEVEAALRHHPAVYDAIVVGRPSPRWGQEVVAVVQLRPGSDVAEDELAASCRAHIASYKAPKAVVLVERVRRDGVGKGDYHWARAVAAEAAPVIAGGAAPGARPSGGAG
jgi:acyl-CoA synthetase (AMP-forming)/AMP-acid ligase II